MNTLIFRLKQLLIKGAFLTFHALRPALNFILTWQGKDIAIERQRRALASTVDYVERHLRHVDSVRSRFQLLTRAFQRADISGDRLVCEFGVFTGSTINHIAKLTRQRVFGFDSFAGLPERWRDTCSQGLFAMPKLPRVRANVTLVQGLFHETLPRFLEANRGTVGFLHVDCDLYSSTKVIFEFLEKRLEPGSVIVFDEYFNYPEWEQGEYKAFQEFLGRTGLSCEFIGYNRYEEQVAVILRPGS